jgi:membrane protein
MSPLNKYNVIYLVYVGVAIALIISLALIIKYRLNGVIGTILSIGYMACLLIIVRYANVELSIEAMFGFIVAFMIGTIFNIFVCSEFKDKDMTNKEFETARNKVFKKFILSLVPILIFALIACLFSLSSLFSFGTILFWSIVVAIVYYCSLTVILMDSMRKRN